MSDTIAATDLQALQEIALPAPVSWLPQTVGWLVVALLFAILLLAWAWYRWRRWRADRYRRDALVELDAIEARLRTDELHALRALPALLKRVALGFTPRMQVAALSGDEWLRFLESTAPREKLSGRAGQLLWQLAFAPDTALRDIPREERDALCESIRDWIRHHAAV